MKLSTKKLTLVTLLTSVYVIIGYFPGIPMIGSSDSTIDLTRGIEMPYGFLLGPLYGPIATFMGALIGKTLKGGGIGMYFTPLAIVSALISGALYRKNIYKVKGWIIAASVFGVLLLGWYLTEAARVIPLYAFFHILSFGVILLFREKLFEYMHSEDRKKLVLGVALSSFPATMAAHLLGNIIYTILFNPDPLFYMSILPVSLIERLVFTVISTLLATPLIEVVRKNYSDILSD